MEIFMTEELSVTSVPPRIHYIASGSLDTFIFNFRIFDEQNIRVYVDGKRIDTGYTVEKEKKTVGGKVVFNTPPKENARITITRHLVFERLSDFQEGGALRARTLNKELDYHTACLQQVEDREKRTLTYPPDIASAAADMELPSPSAGKALVWNETETALQNSSCNVDEQFDACKELAESAETSMQEVTRKTAEMKQYSDKISEYFETVDPETIANTDLSNLSEEGLGRFDEKINGRISKTGLNEITEENARKMIGNRIWISGEYQPAASSQIIVNLPDEVKNAPGFNPMKSTADALLVCKTAQAGYEPGDTAQWTVGSGSYSQASSSLVRLNASTVALTVGNNTGGLLVINKTTGADATATHANWRFIFRVFY